MHDFMHDIAKLVARIECTMKNVDIVEIIDARCCYVSFDCDEVKRSYKFLVALYSAKNIKNFIFILSIKLRIRFG